jgi:hypothetical protein
MVNENLNIIASSSPINLTNIVNTNYSKDSSGIITFIVKVPYIICNI